MNTHTTPDPDELEFEPASPDKLHAHHRRQLSAMLDGELSPDQARFMLRRLEHDDELAACWERWQVCGDVLRGQRSALLPADFSQRVSAAVAGDAGRDVAPPVSATKSRLGRWGGGAALAASVALVALFMTRQLPEQTPGPAAPMAATAPAAPSASTATDVLLATQQESPAELPARDPAGSTAAALATVVAAAEVPRRAAERRSRRQPQPVRVLASAEAAIEPAGLSPVPVFTAAVEADPDPFAFAPPAMATQRPWPRAVLPGLARGDAFSARYGASVQRSAFDPFEPRLDAGPLSMPPPVGPGDRDADPATHPATPDSGAADEGHPPD